MSAVDIIKLSSRQTKEFWEIPVLYEDQDLLAIDKPSRLLTSPDRYDPTRANLMKLLHRDIERGAPWTLERGVTYLANAHRLDFETSGVLLLAKNKPALIAVANQFGAEKPHKTYIALVAGSPDREEFQVEAKIGMHPGRPGFMRVDPKDGKRSSTRFMVMERFSGYALIKCFPATGRTHQIRVHLRHKRLPLVGDALYGGSELLLSSLKPDYRLSKGKTEKPLMARVALHAEELTLEHPSTHQQTTIASPWPKDLQVAIKYLRRFASAGSALAPQEMIDSERTAT